jgi:predicted enzyme related to lactoylglutathione lyase
MLGNAKVLATLPAEDIQRAVKFYTEVLGLQVSQSDDGSALLEAGDGSQIFMYQRARTVAEHTAATFEVADIEAAVKGLTDKGVTFEQYDFGEIKTNELGIAEIGPTKSAWLTDPEGNILSLVSM